MDAPSLQDLSQHFTEKLSRLTESLAIQSCVESTDEDIRAESCQAMQTLWQEVDELSDILTLVRSKCTEQRKSLAQVQALKDKLALLVKGTQYTSSNIPPHLPAVTSVSSLPPQTTHPHGEGQKTDSPKPPVQSQAPVASAKTTSQTSAKPDHAASKQPQLPCPLMEYLTVDEFTNIPKYMKGRLSYQQVNRVIDELNKVFVAKYKLLKQKKSTMNDLHRKLYENFKMQESKDTRGAYFVVERDIKEWSSLKMSRETLSLFTILRHCGRLCEIRGDGYIRYTMIDMY